MIFYSSQGRAKNLRFKISEGFCCFSEESLSFLEYVEKNNKYLKGFKIWMNFLGGVYKIRFLRVGK